ncbi:hypothetical protein [Sphingobium lignivorans]|uniref:Helix-turn-helix domain-containing protein n=1 Tax=Sphingobium lignivorans TaxID=2735886 RepID=A0ABR6NFF6_9SPHN|nr:hypothetical protein [Sphingobium lignivorans]MBB5986006.1 hypothetical protein [Sphingobium lignivorans]
MAYASNRYSSGQWIGTPLHDFLVGVFPAYADEMGGLLIVKLAEDMGMSREGVYKWMRSGRLSKAGVETLHGYAVRLSPGTAPAREEFSKFLFA